MAAPADVNTPVKVVLLDIGNPKFPYCLSALPRVLSAKWDAPEFAPYRHAFPAEHRSSPSAFEAHVRHLVGNDVKIAYLKALQGYLWEDGYLSGSIRAPLFPDVAPAIMAWRAEGIAVMIYSSGSVPAQKLLFGHTDATPSDLRPEISDWFDTANAGPKTEPGSYKRIAAAFAPDVEPCQWLFLSDNTLEVDAARAAGLQSLVVTRPGNAMLSPDHHLGSTMMPDFSGLRNLLATP